MTEIWKPIPGFEEFYEVSNTGLVKKIKGRKKGITSGSFTGCGYKRTRLSSCGTRKIFLIHRLVLLAFMGEPPTGKFQTNHKNGIRHDNRLENLEYVSSQENIQHAYQVLKREAAKGDAAGKSKLREVDIHEIRRLLSEGVLPGKIAEDYCVSEDAIINIARKLSWKHIPNDEEIQKQIDIKAKNWIRQRRSKVTQEKAKRVIQMLDEGLAIRKINRETGVSRDSIRQIANGDFWMEIEL